MRQQGMNILRPGQSGPEVTQWQHFLLGRGLAVIADGDFGTKTKTATEAFQREVGLTPDGVVGRMTLAKAIELGYGSIEPLNPDGEEENPHWPPKPDFTGISAAERASLFGTFLFEHAPAPGNPEAIRIRDDWALKNITKVLIPQLVGKSGAPSTGNVYFHAKGADQLKALWQAWEDAGLLDLVLSWEGSYVPRFVRGSRTYLSNHSWGTAFDINARWNALGVEPALAGRTGSVRKLVGLANEHGFFWGGHWGSRPDGMHFELARVLG